MMNMTAQPYRKFIWSGAALVGLLIIGTLGYWFIGNRQYSPIDSLYMTVITVTTIGFGEIVDLSGNSGGRIFTMFVAISGIGIMGYAATNATVLLMEGQLTDSLKRRRMENTAKNSKGHYIVCGAGNVGLHIAGELVSTGRTHVIIEMDAEKFARAQVAHKNAVCIQGNPSDNDVLLKAGIENAAGLFAVTGDDNLNMVVCLTARQLAANLRIVAECAEVSNEQKLKRVGADSVISSSYISGLRMASEMVRPTVTTFLDIMLRDRDRNLRVEEVTVPEHFPEVSLSISGLKTYAHSLLMAVKQKDSWLYNPPGSHVLKPGEVLVFMTTPAGKAELEKAVNSKSKHL
jgi:voltage-gated potassium channel